MSDIHDLVTDRADADAARRNADAYGGMIEDGREGDPALAVLLAANVIAKELRALGTMIDYSIGKNA